LLSSTNPSKNCPLIYLLVTTLWRTFGLAWSALLFQLFTKVLVKTNKQTKKEQAHSPNVMLRRKNFIWEKFFILLAYSGQAIKKNITSFSLKVVEQDDLKEKKHVSTLVCHVSHIHSEAL
jgi:hypothetical protein